MKLVVLAAAGLTALVGLRGDVPKTYIGSGDPKWLATDQCSFPDADQCAAERAAREVLRNGPVRVPG